MQNWILFPNETGSRQLSEPESLDRLLFLLSHDQRFMISGEEWHTLMPESRKKLQEPSLGFCCGDLSGGSGSIRDLRNGLPEVRIRKYESDLSVMQKAWNNDFSCTIRSSCALPAGWILTTEWVRHTVSVPGMLIQEQSFFVWGSKGTRFSKYRLV